MKIENTKGQSPYAKYNKQPHKYSDAYQRWSASVARSGLYSDDTFEADKSFRRAHNIPVFKREIGWGSFR